MLLRLFSLLLRMLLRLFSLLLLLLLLRTLVLLRRLYVELLFSFSLFRDVDGRFSVLSCLLPILFLVETRSVFLLRTWVVCRFSLPVTVVAMGLRRLPVLFSLRETEGMCDCMLRCDG